MKLRGIEFGKVLCGSGARGFFGEGYWFHRPLRPFGLNWDGSTFVAKTTTMYYNEGNMPLNSNLTPRSLFPDCIYCPPMQWIKGNALNAVGLSGPGAGRIFQSGRLQRLKNNFFLSVMPVAKTPEGRLQEIRHFVDLLKLHLPDFQARIGLQLNGSCPNTKHNLAELIRELYEWLTICGSLGIPLVVKLNILVAIEAALEISQHPECDGLCISNTIPYGQLPELIPWKKLFGSELLKESPLGEYDGGGLSGKLLLPILLDWLRRARAGGITKPINAGGGILSVSDAVKIFEAMGCSDNDSVSLGSIAFLRPWRVRGIIKALNSR